MLDHLYFVHLSTNVLVDILTDARLMYRSTYQLTLDRYVGQHTVYHPTLD